MFPSLRVWFENLERAEIDWTRTLVYVNETYRSSPAVWINRQIGLSEERMQELRDEVTRLLLGLVNPKTGQRAISEVIQTHEVYEGEHAAQAPDLLPSWWEDGFLLVDSEPGGPADLQVERSSSPIVGGVEFAGSHRMEGVLILNGPPICQQRVLSGAGIIDVAPTILHLMGLPIPPDMDGKVLSDCLQEHFLTANPVQAGDDNGQPTDDSRQRVDFTADEQDAIARRLQALGYLSR
jgi:predicted AlkP superfamily phosphohydrolase/phosphomutase